MYDGEVILKVEDLSKTYYSYPLAVGGVGDVLRNMVRDSTLDSKAEVHALSGVSFDLKRGDSLGVIGPNGAGKSTLLKILSGVSAPSSGSVTINGRVLSVLDIGTGFHPDLSGRENVYLSAEILGMSRKEIDLKYKEIIEFSGIDEFINRPVKHYSSGMYLRLAFSVVVSLDADLLLFDEVLGVGDATFRLRTSARMRELTRSGRSIILVSHNMAEIVETCNRCVRLENGSVRDVGHSIQMVARYGERALTGQELCHNDENAPLQYTEGNGAISIKSPECRWSRLDAPGNGEFLLTRLAVIATGKGIADKVYMKDSIEIQLELEKMLGDKLELGILLTDIHGSMVLGGTTMMSPTPIDGNWKGKQLYTVTIPGNLLNFGVFCVSVAHIDCDNRLHVFGDKLVYFKVHFNEEERDRPWFEHFPGVVRPILSWEHTKLDDSFN